MAQCNETAKLKEMEKKAERLDNLNSRFENFRVSGRYSDFTIKVRGKEFKVHKFILAAQSSVFDDMFSADTADEAKTFKNIKNFSEKSFESFLNFFYTGRIDPAVNAVETFELASEFDVTHLKATSIERILADLNEDNALKIFNLGKQYASEELTHSAFRTLHEIYPDLVDELIDDADTFNEVVVAKQRIAAILKSKSVGTIKIDTPLSNASGGPNNSGRSSMSQNIEQTAMQNETSLQPIGNEKLNEVKDVWRPQTLFANVEEDRDIKVTKLCRSILNKLTPENFATLSAQFKTLQIDTADILDKCVSMMFEKAIMEPKYSAIYAQLCKEVSNLFAVPFDKNNSKQMAVFKMKLISQCQAEFEKHCNKKLIKNNTERLKEIEDEDDATKKAELNANYELESFKIRRRAVGTIIFIGELYKHGLLTSKVILSCICLLTSPTKRTEKTLECLCKLLSTTGQHLEQSGKLKVNLPDYFSQLEAIADKNSSISISSRIRFMIQDLIALRKNKWIPRPLQRELKPMTLDEIKRQVDES